MNKKTAIITGASGDIGKAISEKLAQDNFNLILNGWNSFEKLIPFAADIKNRYPVDIYCHKADISNETQVKEMFSKAVEKLGNISVLVNCAGISFVGLIQDTTEEIWNRIFDINTKGVFLCSKEAVKLMVSQKSGNIINITSMWGQTGASCETAYSASKGAIDSFTKALAKEIAPSGIRVNAISPGMIATKMNSHLSSDEIQSFVNEIPTEKIGQPKDIADAVSFLVSDQASYITGQIIGINGGYLI